MKIVIVGGSGQIGTRLCSRLYGMGHDVVDASPVDGVDVVSGAGLAAALEGAQVVIDVSEAPAFDGVTALAFFRRATRRLMEAERVARVRHHVLLSVVGADRFVEGGYFRAKLHQEELAIATGIPFTILRSTQFMHFFAQVADSATDNGTVRVAPVLVQPVDAEEVADMLAACAVDAPSNRVVELAGPAPVPLDDAVRRYLASAGDARQVVADAAAPFFGATLTGRMLLPDDDARCGSVTFETWLDRQRDSFARDRVHRAWLAAHPESHLANPHCAALRPGRYVIDPLHTRVLFSVSHFGLSTFYGELARPTGTLRIDPAAIEASALSIAVAVADITTGNRMLDEELCSANWLDSDRFPIVQLAGRQYWRAADDTLAVGAYLTLHGVTRLVLLDVHFVGAGINPKKGVYTAGFDVRGTIRRSDFGVDTAPLIGNELDLIISVAAELVDGTAG